MTAEEPQKASVKSGLSNFSMFCEFPSHTLHALWAACHVGHPSSSPPPRYDVFPAHHSTSPFLRTQRKKQEVEVGSPETPTAVAAAAGVVGGGSWGWHLNHARAANLPPGHWIQLMGHQVGSSELNYEGLHIVKYLKSTNQNVCQVSSF